MQPKQIFQWILLAGIFGLTACSGLLESPLQTDRTFMLQPLQASQAEQGTSLDETFILKLRVVPGLDTDRLVTVSDNAEINHFSAALWPDNLPEFTQSLIERSLRAHGWLSVEHSNSDSAPNECELKLEIEKFYTLLDPAGQPSSVQIQWDGYYNCDARSVPVRVSESVLVGQKDVTGVVRAHQQGFDLAMRSTIHQMDAHRAE